VLLFFYVVKPLSLFNK